MCAIVEINTLLALLVMYYFQLLHRKPLIILYLICRVYINNSQKINVHKVLRPKLAFFDNENVGQYIQACVDITGNQKLRTADSMLTCAFGFCH